MPRSLAWMAFSMSFMVPASQGWIVSVLGSGEAMLAIWLMGVGVP